MRQDEATVAAALAALKAGSGSHSPSVAEIERALPGLVEVDACFLSNPYATELVLSRLRALDARALDRLVSHYPSQGAAVAGLIAPSIGVPDDQVLVGNGACEVIQALLADAPGPLLLSVPTFSAYYEFATGPVVAHQLDPEAEFHLDLAELDALVDRHAPETVVVISPNNPDGGPVDHDELVAFVRRLAGRVRQVIVDESFGQFASEAPPPSLAGLVAELPHLVVVNSLSKSHGIAGLRLGYGVMAPERARALRHRSLWNSNAFAEWFAGLLTDPGYRDEYEAARRRYVHASRELFARISALPGAHAFPTAANFVLIRVPGSAADVAAALLGRFGVYVRDCDDKEGLEVGRYLRVSARDDADNARILEALAIVLPDVAARAPAPARGAVPVHPDEPDGPDGHPDAALVPG